jgi:hypothetical protein
VNRNLLNFKYLYFVTLVAGVAVLVLGGCVGKQSKPRSHTEVLNPEFSPDDRTLAFTYCQRGRVSCDIGVVDLETDQINIFTSPNSESWGSPKYSRDGKLIAFHSFNSSGWGFNQHYSSLATMNADGTDVQKITARDAYRVGPVFSPDGQRLAYIASEVKNVGRWSGQVFGKHIREIEISSGIETKLAENIGLSLSKVHYLPDGNSFLFSGKSKRPGYSKYGEVIEYAIWKGWNNTRRLDQIITADDVIGVDGLSVHGYAGKLIGISGNGQTVAFRQLSGYTKNRKHVYSVVIRKDSKFHVVNFDSQPSKKVQQFSALKITDGGLSFDGDKLAFQVYDRVSKINSIWLGNVDGTMLRQLVVE